MLLMAWKAPRHMEPEYTTQLQHILERMTVGVAILDCTTLRVLYANSYLTSFCPEPWRTLGLVDRQGDPARRPLPAGRAALPSGLRQRTKSQSARSTLRGFP
jgi:hypothetical protein